MATPVIAVIGLVMGGLCTGAVMLGGAASSLSLGSPDIPTVSSVAPGTPVLLPSTLAQIQAASASCPGLDWTLLAGGVLVDPALAAGLTSAATALCQSSNPSAALVGLLPGPEEGQVALVLSHALDANPAMTAQATAAITFAAENLGVPYRWGGTGAGGFDCSGLTLEAYKAAGIVIPRVAQAQYDAGPQVPAGVALEPGDLLFFGSGPTGVSHVGLFIGGGDMIDAPHTGADVRIEPAPTAPGARFGSDVVVGATRPGGL
jgi:cell wall-associated NlpC family hydrolase